MIAAPPSATRVDTGAIRSHYDLATPFYRLLWGPHIHHGLWSEEDVERTTPLMTPRRAQEQLTDTLAMLAGIRGGERVLDVGCGMGGSSIRLARRRGCRVTGVTLSGVQRRWAALAAALTGVGRLTQFVQVDVEAAEFAPAGFDVVWSIECTEHLFDKAALFRRARGWLRPGGRVAICAWLAAEGAEEDGRRAAVEAVCRAFLCPSLGTFADYAGWMADAGLVVERQEDWTRRVARTWELCDARVRRLALPWLARGIDRRQADFLHNFTTLLDAYRSGAMHYGCIVARLP